MAAWAGASGYAVQNASDLFQNVNFTALLHFKQVGTIFTPKFKET